MDPLPKFFTDLGDCYAWGSNNYGQLGQGNYVLHEVPTLLSDLKRVFAVSVFAGWHHSVIVTGDFLFGLVKEIICSCWRFFR